jgi:hypothetical protein
LSGKGHSGGIIVKMFGQNFFRIRLAVLLAGSLFLLGSTSGEIDKEAAKYLRKYDGAKLFNELKAKFTNQANDVSTYKATEAYNLIVQNMGRFSKLKKKVEKADKISDVLVDVADELTEIAKNYRKIAGLSPNINDYTVKTIDDLLPGEKATEKSVQANQTKIDALQVEISDAQKVLDSETTDVNLRQRNTAIINANKSQINSLRTQNLIWEKFNTYQNRLLSAFEDNGQRIDTILFILGKNADVYDEAARTARMTKNAVQFIGNLNSLQDIDSSLSALQDSWSEVDEVINAIGSIDFEMLE